MTFRPLDPETRAKLAALQKKIDECYRWMAVNSAYGDRLAALERERDAIYQADYDLSNQHR